MAHPFALSRKSHPEQGDDYRVYDRSDAEQLG